MKVLVTGGAGFIGSHVVDRMLEDGHEVIVVDNLLTGNKENINPQAKFYEVDILNSKAVNEVLLNEKPEIVSHHAAQIDVRKSINDPVFDAEENIIGSINIMLGSIEAGVRKIIYASTVAAYGEPQNLPVAENHQLNPISQYGISKHTVEHYLHLYSVNYGLKYTAIRYPNVYGPRQDPKGEAGVVAIFTNELLEGNRPTIFGDGEQTRDFLHVYDVAEANLAAINSGDNQILNIGTGVEVSVNHLFDIMTEILELKLKPVYGSARVGEIERIRIDASAARRELGWTPKFSIHEGIKQTIEYYKEAIP